MSDPKDSYIVNVVFRGLFLAQQIDGRGFAVLLPDARSIPGVAPDSACSCEHEAEEREKAAESAAGNVPPPSPQPQADQKNREIHYREHHGILEFYQSDWANPTERLPNLMRVNKTHKEPVAFYLLNKQEIRFRSLFGTETKLSLPQLGLSHQYRTEGRIKVLEKDSVHGMNLLTPFGSKLKPGAWQETVAYTVFVHGEVFSERLSAVNGAPVPWEFRRLSEPGKSAGETHFINLDLRVRFRLAPHDSLVIELFDFPEVKVGLLQDGDILLRSDARNVDGRISSFTLHPKDPEKGLTIWVKNRELDTALQDSDLLPDPFQPPCSGTQRLDRDHGYLGLLATKPGDVVLPFSREPGIAQCGQACGGCGGGP